MAVPSILKPKAQVAVVYGNVSVEDEAQGAPLRSKAAQILFKYLSGSGISSTNISIIPIYRNRVKPGQIVTLEEKALWKELLRRDLSKINPNLIIAMGDDALAFLTEFQDASKYRGSVLQSTFGDAKVLCIENIEKIFEDPKLNPIMFWDCQKAARHMHTKDLMRKPLEIIITKDLNLLAEEFLNDDYINNPDSLLAFDIESCDKWLTCIGFAKSVDRAFVIPLSRMLDSELPSAYRLINRILSSPVKKVAQNGNFDITYLAHFYRIKTLNFWWDTMLAFHAMYSNLPKGLDMLASIFTEEPYWKCLKGDAQVLTKMGWIRLDELPDNAVIMASNIQGELNWGEVTKTSFPFDGMGIAISSLRHSCWYTPEHKVPVQSIHGDARKPDKAKNLGRRIKLVSAGQYVGGNISYKGIKLLVAIQADGSVRDNYVQFNLVKERKITRLKELCYELGVEISEYPSAITRDRFECGIQGDVVNNIIAILGENKDFGPWLLDLDLPTIEAFLNELQFWDGWQTYNGDALNYSSSNWNNIQWASTIGHCLGYTTHIMRAAGDAWDCWKVSFKNTNTVSLKPYQSKPEYFSGQVYCVTTEPGYFLCKNGNDIFITGNSDGKDWRGQEKFNAQQWQDFYEYNGKDVANTLEIALAQAPMLKDRGTEHIFRQEMDLCYPLITMELHGVNADLSKKEQLREKNAVQVAKASLFLHHLVWGDPSVDSWQKAGEILLHRKIKKKAHPLEALNISSPKMMKDYLYNKMKLPKRVKGGKVTTDENALISLQKAGHELIGTVLFLRKYKKAGAFYQIKAGEDGRIRCCFKPGGTETGRLSSSKSITKTGSNLQNIPKDVRIFFTADEGYLFIQPDYAKAESWIVAYLADDEKMLTALRSADFHSTNASEILGKPVTKENYSDRQLGKKISHAANYRVTPFTMVKSLAKEGYIFSKTECQGMLDSYFRAYPRVKTFQENIIDELRKNDMTLKSPWGRKMTFFKHWGNDLFNAACAFKPQSTVGDMTNRALINLYHGLDDIDGAILLQVHDSIPMQIRKEQVNDSLVERIKNLMSVPITIRGETFTIPIDIEVGDNWYELEDWDKYKRKHNLC